ncbi:hypothetical protein [Pseudomonas sp. NA-150]|uniref:hypothetical protein n=1 Tax=Pseudomonas sp. NA-150 TaxID=3367525 RepID=UPI0037C7F514
MDVYSQALTQERLLFATIFGGDQSPLNDSDADDDDGYGGELDLDVLGLDDFIDSDKLDSTISGDVGSSSLS